MKSRGMQILIIAIVILGAYAAYDYYGEEQAVRQKLEQAKLMPFKKDQVTEIRIEKADKVLLMKRDIDGWHIEEPIKDWADSESVDIFLGSLEGEVAKDIPKEGDAIDWALYGLDKPEAKIKLKSSNGESIIYSVSGQKNYEQNTFLRKNDEKKVYVVNATWQARANKGVAEMRDLRLLRHKMAGITHVDFKNTAGQLELAQKDGHWIRVDQPNKKIDQNRVYNFLQSIADTRAEKIILEKAPSQKELYDYFLEKPVAEIKLQLGDKLWTAKFGAGANKDLYASVSDPVFLLKIETGNIDKFFKVKPDEFFEQEKK